MAGEQMKSAACELRVSVEGLDQVKADLALLAKAAEGFPHIFEALIDFFGSGVEACTVNIDPDATALTGNLRIKAKLADRLADLVSALGTVEVDAL